MPERLVRRFGLGIRFVRDQGVWRVWDGKRWKTDRRNRVDRLAKHVVRELHDEAASAEGDEAKRRYQWAFKSGGRDRRNAMVNLAAMEKDMVTVTTDYDRDAWLFNLQNGVLDLKTGKLLPHSRKRLHSKISPVTYDPAATCPLFEKFISEIMGGDQAMVDFLAAAAGYSMTGETKEQMVMVSHGNGQNGKSVFHITLKHILGDYAEVASFDTFVKKKNDNGPKNDLAKLVGARMVMASESQDGERLDEALVKNVTGGEPITVRFLHKEFFTYEPEFKVWMSSNYKPAIKGTDWGIWRRIKLIPFDVVIPENRRDRQLTAKLRKEASGILNWMLKGLARNREEGFVYPEKVRAATTQYRDSQDVVGQFLRAKCIVTPYAEIKGAELYTSYKTWCDANREWVMKERQFTEALLRVGGITTKRKEDGKWYVGVGQTVFSKTYDQLPSDVEVI
jgi:putative DNA primase/helicase